MYVRLAFAVAVHVDPDILLVDEVLAVGDEPFQRKCMDRIRSFQDEGRTIVLVTHGLDQVADVCDRAVVLEHGQVKADDVPANALRVLRSDFDHIRAEELSRANVEHGEEPEPFVKVSAIEALSDGQPVQTVEPGQSMTVRVTLEARKRLEDWILGMGIDSATGQVIYGTNSKLHGRAPRAGRREPPSTSSRSRGYPSEPGPTPSTAPSRTAPAPSCTGSARAPGSSSPGTAPRWGSSPSGRAWRPSTSATVRVRTGGCH